MTSLATQPQSKPDSEAMLNGAIQNLMTIASTAGKEAQHTLAASANALALAAGELLEETKKQSSDLARGAAREVKEHPIATAAAITVAAAAVIGVIAAYQQRQADSSPQEDLQAKSGASEKKQKKHKADN